MYIDYFPNIKSAGITYEESTGKKYKGGDSALALFSDIKAYHDCLEHMEEKNKSLKKDYLVFREIRNAADKAEMYPQLIKDLDQAGSMVESFGRHMGDLKDKLDELKKETPDSCAVQAVKNQFDLMNERYHKSFDYFHKTHDDIHYDNTKRLKVMADEMYPDLTEEQKDEIAAGDNGFQILEQLSQEDQDGMKALLGDIAERNQNAKNVEKRVLAINAMMKEFAIIVKLNGEKIKHIGELLKETKDFTIKAEEEIAEAEVYQKEAAGNTGCIILLCSVGGGIAFACIIFGIF